MSGVLRHKGWDFRVSGEQLTISADGVVAGEFNLCPSIEGQKPKLEDWKQLSDDHFTAQLSDGSGSVHLSNQEGHVCYWMDTSRTAFEKLSYFPDSRPTGPGWHTYLSDELDRFWDIDLDVTVPVSSCYALRHADGADGAGMLDPCDRPQTWMWNIPVRAMSLQSDAGWLGLSIPGPLPVGVTRFSMSRQRYTMSFEMLRPGCEQGSMPRVYFVPALAGAYDVLDVHRQISDQLGLIKRKQMDEPAWWGQPLYKYWDELFRRHLGRFGQYKSLHIDEQGKEVTDLTTTNLLDWTKTVSESIRLPMNITLEQGAFLRYGQYTPTQSLGGIEGFRRTVDQLREQGTHTAFFYHQYNVDSNLPIYRDHPEYFCKPRPNAPELKQGTPVAPNEKLMEIDWTHPGGRQYMLDLVEFLISDKPGCLNVDYLAVNNNMGPDPRYLDFHDPDWGIGDLMQYKVQRLIYEHAKRIKPDCIVRRQSACDCYMQPFADNVNCCEDWHSTSEHWYRRAQIVTRLMPQVHLSVDAWFVTLTKNSEYYMAVSVWNVPEAESVTHAIHPYMYHRPLREKEYRRRRAGMQVYNNAPVKISHECRVSWHPDQTIEAWRKYTDGPLEGFYAALALSRKSFVTYNTAQALIACSESRIVRVPLPTNARITAVEMVEHDGAIHPWQYTTIDGLEHPTIEMHLQDCGFEPMYYRIRYRLGDSGKSKIQNI